jgi:hypothetical protein
MMDFTLDGVKWWSLIILDGYARTMLAYGSPLGGQLGGADRPLYRLAYAMACPST